MTPLRTLAPELDVSEWIGKPSPLAELRGQVVVIEAFQMLCAGCVYYGIPQAQRIRRAYPEIAVIGLNTVFEHAEVTGPDALRVFLTEFGIYFPVGIDRREDGQRLPATMRTYDLEGTPSLIVIGKDGTLRYQHLGQIDELKLGVMLGRLLAE